jgi:hypothetical protein
MLEDTPATFHPLRNLHPYAARAGCARDALAMENISFEHSKLGSAHRT